MATAFQFEDLDLLGQSKTASSSPAPPSIVSMASEMFATGLIDPEQFVPSSMTDLFEGALCDDGAFLCLDAFRLSLEPVVLRNAFLF